MILIYYWFLFCIVTSENPTHIYVFYTGFGGARKISVMSFIRGKRGRQKLEILYSVTRCGNSSKRWIKLPHGLKWRRFVEVRLQEFFGWKYYSVASREKDWALMKFSEWLWMIGKHLNLDDIIIVDNYCGFDKLETGRTALYIFICVSWS